MNWLLFQLPEPEMLAADTPGRLRWLRLRRNGAFSGQGEATPEELRTLMTPDDRTIALLPGERAPLHRVFVPGKSKRIRHRALPFALEDRLSEDLEQLRIVAGPRHGAETTASVAARRDLKHWEAWLHDQGIHVAHLIPDLSLLRGLKTDDRAILLAGTQRSILLSPDAEPLAMPGEVAAWWLQQHSVTSSPENARGEGQTAPDTPRVIEPGANPDPRTPLHPPPGWSGGVLELLLHGLQSGDTLTPALQQTLRSALAFDFASPATGSPASSLLPPSWRVPAALALALGALWMGALWLEVAQLEQEYRVTEREIASLFEATLPQSRMVDPVAQFEALLEPGEAEATTATSPGPLGASMASIMASLAPRDLALQRLRGEPGRLELELEGSGIAELERLREDLREALTARVRIVSAETGERGVRARMTIEQEP
ncbi:type II secretion system protein GspL [Thioalkalivibrio sp. ALJT]|uniref:type II secretion system protein GspL n=1 Tax=Thioalkalivibrio sp. ALJT TaxID=1158146 RepID=UPI0003826C1C|nr:type II secretion system protein GspL [Thioalkalivibrio sp. ALJT]